MDEDEKTFVTAAEYKKYYGIVDEGMDIPEEDLEGGDGDDSI